ncbi:DUF1036 domain-containing protein [Pseudoruegeria sp. HB172150]|uniref:DUF1036 domain-containing protein n=1 Tax=Pseudoruegeria sp. HB172150 TaxID=2721164 RepID=UPI0015575963|nr:DUF1036 domain-containing protein [Pseudoruegeria sp. HB172150]
MNRGWPFQGVLVQLVLWFCLSVDAEAGLNICNETDLVQTVAIGFKGETNWTSEGWWNIDPDDCATVLGGDLDKRYYYYYAESDAASFQGQDYQFCADDEVFTIVGDTDCESRGFETLSMREIDTGETATDFTLTLVDDGGAPDSESKVAPKIEDGGPTTGGIGTGGSRGPGGPADGQPVNEVVQDTTIVPPEESEMTVLPEDLITDLAEGRHGKGFETIALFQGCELAEGRDFCSFHAGEWKMRVFYRGPTPDTLMYALEELPVNMPVLLKGDMVETHGNFAAIVVRGVVPKPGEDENSRLRAMLQGDWREQGTGHWEMTVLGSEIYYRQDGDFSTSRFFRIQEICDGSGGEGPFLVQINSETNRRTCYRIARADSTALELTDVRRGRTTVYQRMR